MAIVQPEHHHQNPSFLLLLPPDALYCEEVEEQWEAEEEEEEEVFVDDYEREIRPNNKNAILEHDLFWEDEELLSLLSKEKEILLHLDNNNDSSSSSSAISLARGEAVDWILKTNVHYGFTALTAILAINYLDRFLGSFHLQREKPWMTQLTAVTCLSLAAKVEETHVPLLLDLQVDDSKFMFEAKTIQRMELLVLSTLQWRMNPVTPISFLDHVIRRLGGFNSHPHWDFLRSCQDLLLFVISDSRSVGYLPSVLAAATMLHIMNQIDPLSFMDYQNQLLGILKLTKEKVNDCNKLIIELSSAQKKNQKRKYQQFHHHHQQQIPSSPSGVIDAFLSYDDSSNDSWVVDYPCSSSSSSCVSPEPFLKKSRVHEQKMRVPSLVSRVL